MLALRPLPGTPACQLGAAGQAGRLVHSVLLGADAPLPFQHSAVGGATGLPGPWLSAAPVQGPRRVSPSAATAHGTGGRPPPRCRSVPGPHGLYGSALSSCDPDPQSCPAAAPAPRGLLV